MAIMAIHINSWQFTLTHAFWIVNRKAPLTDTGALGSYNFNVI
jgi:hypothetical protein